MLLFPLYTQEKEEKTNNNSKNFFISFLRHSKGKSGALSQLSWSRLSRYSTIDTGLLKIRPKLITYFIIEVVVPLLVYSNETLDPKKEEKLLKIYSFRVPVQTRIRDDHGKCPGEGVCSTSLWNCQWDSAVLIKHAPRSETLHQNGCTRIETRPYHHILIGE